MLKIRKYFVLMICFFSLGVFGSEEKLPTLNVNANDTTEKILESLRARTTVNGIVANYQLIAAKKQEYLTLQQELRNKLSIAEKRFSELKSASSAVKGRAPYLSSLYFRQLMDLQESFAEITQVISAFSEEQVAYDRARSIRDLVADRGESSFSSDSMKTLLGLMDKNLSLRTEILDIIAQMRTESSRFNQELTAFTEKEDDNYEKDFAHYTLFRESFIGNQRGSNLQEELTATVDEAVASWLTFRVVYPMLLPSKEMVPFSLFGCTGLLFALLAVGFLLKRRGSLFWKNYGFICALFAYAFFFQWLVSLSPSASDLLWVTLRSFFFCTGMILLAGEFRRQMIKAPRRNERMLGALILNVILMSLIDLLTSFMVYPRVILMLLLLFSLGMVFVLPWIIYPVREDRYGFLCAGILPWGGWLIGGFLALTGYLYFAVITVTFLALLGMVLFIGQRMTSYLINQCSNSSYTVWKNFIQLLVIPMLWLSLSGGLILRVATIINGDETLIRVLGVNILAPSAFQITAKIVLEIVIFGLVVKFILSYIRYLIDSVAHKHNYDHGGLLSIYLIFSYCVWIGFVLTSLSAFNFNWEHLKWILGGLSVGMGFALKDFADNFLSGITLLIGKEARLGDLIEYDNVVGRVEKISVRATFIRTKNGAVISLPNSQMVAKDFRNWTLLGNIIRRNVTVGVAYNTDVCLVKRTLLDVAAACSKVEKSRPPTVFFQDFEASEMIFTLNFWTHTDYFDSAANDIRFAIVKAFNENHIEMAFPQLDVHLEMPLSGESLRK